MHRFPFNVVETLLISALLVVCFHILPWNQTRQRTNLLKDPAHLSTGTYPSWATSEQQAYLASLRDDSQQAIDVRKEIASGSVENQYNLGTYLALHSVTSGEVTDLNSLHEAEKHLSGAADLQTTNNDQVAHNLRTVRELLTKEQKTEQQEKTAGEEEQKSEQKNQENNKQQPSSGTENQNTENQQQGGEQQQAELSESMKQQLEQYQQQLLAEQAQNQQFFDKRPLELGQNDPFAGLNQLFGGDPQFDQQTDSGTKDW